MKKIIFLLTVILLVVTCKKKKDEPAAPQPQPAVTQYSVVYNGNGNTGGTVPVDATVYESGSTAVVLDNSDLVKTNFSFVGWNTAADGSGTDHSPSSSITMNSNITLYAKWAPGVVYKVTYNGNGNTSGSAPVDNTTYAAGSQVTVQNNSGNLSKNGESFKNWNTSASGNGQSYSSGSTFNISGNTTLYAMYNTTVP